MTTQQEAMAPGIAMLTAWLTDGDEYQPDLPSTATNQILTGLTETERAELFFGSVPLVAKRLLMDLAAVVALDPLEVLRRLAEGDAYA